MNTGFLEVFTDFCKLLHLFVDRRLLPKAWAWVCLSLLAFLREVGPPTLFELFELQFLKTRCTVVYRSPLAAGISYFERDQDI